MDRQCHSNSALLVSAEPTAKKFTDGQLKPAADKVAANAKPMADKFNNEQLLPAADKIAQNAKPTADKLANQQIKPAAQKVAEQAVPRTQDFTEGVLQPGAKRLADNAEPMGDKLIKEGVQPLADVSASQLCMLMDESVSRNCCKSPAVKCTGRHVYDGLHTMAHTSACKALHMYVQHEYMCCVLWLLSLGIQTCLSRCGSLCNLLALVLPCIPAAPQ